MRIRCLSDYVLRQEYKNTDKYHTHHYW